jgi:thiamine biosynthesis lipoprotein
VDTMTEPQVRRHEFRAMGTTVALIAPIEPAAATTFLHAARLVERQFEAQEQRFSRFRADSELSQVNAGAGRSIVVSGPFAALVATALEAAEASGGLFDPTLWHAMVEAGYDRDFDELIVAAREVLHPAAPTGRWREIVLEADHLTLPVGVALDLGGIAKGWTADRAAMEMGSLLPWAVVDAGGDLRVAGHLPQDGLEIGIEHPLHEEIEVLRLRLNGGALATSSVVRRSWGPNLHHLIDPRTGRPSTTEVLQATVWADRCVDAEVRAKEALLSGPTALDHLSATLVLRDGAVVTNMTETSHAARATA